MKKIVIIDHFSQTPDEPGNNRFVYLAEMLIAKGFQVEIITTSFSHKAKQQRNLQKGMLDLVSYDFTMLYEPGYKKNVCLKRFYSHYIFGEKLKKYLKKIEKPDLIFAAVPSLNVGATASNYCKKNNIPFIIDIQDLWPEAFKLVIHVPFISDMIFFPMTLQANNFYAQADKIIAVSDTYKNRGLKNNKKDPDGLCVFLGTDLKQFDENSKLFSVEKPPNTIWVTYVGTLGLSYNIEIIIDALNIIAEKVQRPVKFNVFGDGPYLNRFKKYAADCKIPVTFFGRLNYSQMSAYLCKSDIAVNPIVKGAAQSIINKHADYAAAGLPVLNTQQCQEYRNLINEYQCGINCDVDSVEQVANALLKLIEDEALRKKMGMQSRRLAEEKFDRVNTYRLIVAEIKKLV